MLIFSDLVSCLFKGAKDEETRQSGPWAASLPWLTVRKAEKDWEWESSLTYSTLPPWFLDCTFVDSSLLLLFMNLCYTRNEKQIQSKGSEVLQSV